MTNITEGTLLALSLLGLLLIFGSQDAWASDKDSEPQKETVVLLHGLARTERSMKPLEKSLSCQGFKVINIGYPSRKFPIGELAGQVKEKLNSLDCWDAPKVHFVTHSMGGIIVRAMFAEFHPHNLGRVVMLCPPNKGSEVVDHLKDNPLFVALNGQAGRQLGTDPESAPNRLGPVDYEVGVLAGTLSVNPLFSNWLKGEDDGKVSVERAKVEGMSEFLTLPYNHTFFMNKAKVKARVTSFLRTGRFLP
ncbi:esterase/lipase family protein [Desulfatibacillum aliphaticivorans]|uniref:esterase/lipase family protein n=1 Tax=Desulfatibacillum aliphaticivorans TaxID=218208 RepID=UPI000423ED0B|nr:alpha/beta fold hydrolase [Desulfatibacillum aliphaticivorans]